MRRFRARLRSLLRGLRANPDYVLALPTFAVGAASLTILDILSAARLGAQDVSQWALARSVVLVTAPFASLGLGQALIRRQQTTAQIAGSAYLHALVSMPVVAAISWNVGLPALAAMGAGLSSAMLATSTIYSGYLRSQLRVTASIWAIHGWKPLVLAAVVVLNVSSFSTQFGALCGVLLIFGCTALVRLGVPPWRASRARLDGGTYRLGGKFMLFAVLLAAGAYLDQLLLNAAGDSAASASFFRYTTAFLSLPLFLTGFLAHVSASWLRSNAARIPQLSGPLIRSFLLGSIASTAMAAGAGLWLAHVADFFEGDIELPVVSGVLAIGLMRFLYLGPSAILSIFGNDRDLNASLGAGLLGLLLMVVGFFTLTALAVDPIASVIAAILINLLVRNGVGAVLAYRILRTSPDTFWRDWRPSGNGEA